MNPQSTIFILMYLSLFFACTSPSNTKEPGQSDSVDYALNEIYAIINQEFLNIIDTSWYYKPLPIPPMPPPPDFDPLDSSSSDTTSSFDYEVHNGEIEAWENKIEERESDTSRLMVVFSDTLFSFEGDYLRNKYWKVSEHFKRNFCTDTAFIALIDKLLEFETSQPLSVSGITATGRYEIVSPLDFGVLQGDYRKIASLSLSRFAFNEDMTKACFYYSVLHAPLNGEGVILMLDKKGDHWQVICSRVLWVA